MSQENNALIYLTHYRTGASTVYYGDIGEECAKVIFKEKCGNFGRYVLIVLITCLKSYYHWLDHCFISWKKLSKRALNNLQVHFGYSHELYLQMHVTSYKNYFDGCECSVREKLGE